MKDLFFFFLFSLTIFFVKAQSLNVGNFTNFIIKNADSVSTTKDSIVYTLWYPEQGVLLSFVEYESLNKSFVGISNLNPFPIDLNQTYFALTKVDSMQLVKDKELEIYLKNKLQQWLGKKRTFYEYQEIKTSDFWKDLQVYIEPDYEKDCKYYFFNLKSNFTLNNKIMRKILISFEDY